MSEKGFDASRYLTKLNGRDYLEVKWRLLWLRTEHPEAVVSTDLERLEGDLALFRAQVAIPGGGEATGWGSETASDFGDYIEKAETKALGRALAALGYGTQFCEDFAFPGDTEDTSRRGELPVVDAPVERPAGKRVQEQPPPPATPSQLNAIYAIARVDWGLSEEELDQRSRKEFGRPPKELSKREASEFIDQLKGHVASP